MGGMTFQWLPLLQGELSPKVTEGIKRISDNPSVNASRCHLSCARPSVRTGVPLHKGGFGFSLFTFLSSLHPQGASQSASMILICPAVYWVSLMTMSLIRATSVASRPSSPASTTTLQESEPMNTTQSA